MTDKGNLHHFLGVSANFDPLLDFDINNLDLAVGQCYETKQHLVVRMKILSVVQKFDFDVHKLTSFILIAREHSFFLMLELLGRARNLNMARNFLFSIEKRSDGCVKLEDRYFNSLIRSYGNAGLFQESVKLFETMKKMGISPSVVTFNSLLSILLNRGKIGMAHDVFDEMCRTYGVTPDSYTFNILISGFFENSMVDEAFRIFKEMEPYKCNPDLVTYNTIIDGLCRAGKVTIAHNFLNGMMKKATDVHPNIVSYTTLVRGYCMKQKIDQALVMFHELLTRGLKPNAVTYNTLIKSLSEAQRYDEIKQILNVGDITFAPDACTFNILIKAHCDAGHLDAAMKGLDLGLR